MDTKVDWQEIVDKKPKGYLELQNDQHVVHGPIESVELGDDDIVIIKLKWTAEMKKENGIPTFEWKAMTNKPFAFPNLTVPFVIEETPEKGPRVRFGLNILYLNAVEGLDPATVEGLELPTQPA
jgi:hypothetical protein